MVEMSEDRSGPALMIQFYFGNIPTREYFVNMIGILVGAGAQFSGRGLVHRGEGLRDAPFVSPTDELLEDIPITDFKQVIDAASDPNMRLVQVEMLGAVGIGESKDVVTYVYISRESSAQDRHPIAIVADGWMFEGTEEMMDENRGLSYRVGRQAYERFRLLVEKTRPEYGSITVGWHLECPSDLRRNPHSASFFDFFVSESYLRGSGIAQVEELFPECYSEKVGDGVFISCTAFFNPDERQAPIPRRSLDNRSIEVAKLIALRPSAE
jgi:hypothetical protein